MYSCRSPSSPSCKGASPTYDCNLSGSQPVVLVPLSNLIPDRVPGFEPRAYERLGRAATYHLTLATAMPRHQAATEGRDVFASRAGAGEAVTCNLQVSPSIHSGGRRRVGAMLVDAEVATGSWTSLGLVWVGQILSPSLWMDRKFSSDFRSIYTDRPGF